MHSKQRLLRRMNGRMAVRLAARARDLSLRTVEIGE